METGYKVCDAMTRKPIILSSDNDLKECAKEMLKNHVGAIIIKDDGKALGIITEQDIVRKVIAKGINPFKTKLKDVMEKNLISISPEKDIYEALMIMRDKNIRHLPVVDNGIMVGLLTLKDILKIQPQLFDFLVEKFEIREEARKPIYKPKEKEGICQLCGKYSENLEEQDGVLVCENCRKKLLEE